MRLARACILRHSSSRGFSLLEVMVSIIVICVGLLGIAKLQALSISNTTTSRMRALAAIQAASLASAMHSNRQYWFNTAPASVTVTASSTTASLTSTDAALQTQATTDLTSNPTGANPSTACVGTSGGGTACNALPLAAFDLSRWAVSLGALLPNPSATILCPPIANAPASCTILITWAERSVAINSQEATAATTAPTACTAAGTSFQLPCYTLYVEP
jgi:type IV pilus assembly protein PilV